MKRFRKIYSDNLTKPPGHLPDQPQDSEQIRISVIDYDHAEARFSRLERIEDCSRYFSTDTVTWINVDGIYNPELIRKAGEFLGAHPLVLEDIMNPTHRPKFEDHEDFLFIIFRILRFSREEMKLSQEQVSMVLKDNIVMTFQEYEGDIFDSLRNRIKQGEGRIRKMKADYLLSALLDLVVDNYYPILEDIDELIEHLEGKVRNSSSNTSELYSIRNQVSLLHRSVWPVRDVVSELYRSGSRLIDRKTQLFVRDIHDHTLQILDLVDSFRENINGLMELSISAAGDRLNRIMKFLTLVSTIFIPLSFIAGLYGMNFVRMPGIQSPWGFYIICGIMAAATAGMLVFFRKRRWL